VESFAYTRLPADLKQEGNGKSGTCYIWLSGVVSIGLPVKDLQDVQRQTEEMHILSGDQEPDLRVINIDKVDEEQLEE